MASAIAGLPGHAIRADDFSFFETRIRPVLVERCYACHSTQAQAKKKLRGGLYVDSAAGLRTGGASGPAIVPGKPAASLLLQALHYDGDIKMPPKGKLPDRVIADFAAWIKDGAPDPRRPQALAAPLKFKRTQGQSFWAYQPLMLPPVPGGNCGDWPQNPIDCFLLARLEGHRLRPAPPADRSVLIRRLSYDLIGLPPSPADADRFLRDRDPRAYEKLVDRLLASPQFGERWGRHWFDLARYAESVTLRGFVFKEAWRYRDYVIDAFNRDIPLDRFIREQIAGDLLPAATRADRSRQLIATTYLMLGNTNLEEQDKQQLRMDVVDEQLDVIGKGLLAQTITCARCHDHKFDPIPTRDYYALAGILRNTRALEHANVSKWIERPLPADPVLEAAVAQSKAALAALEQKLAAAKASARGATAGAAKGVLAVKDVPGIVVDDAKAMKVGVWNESTYSGSYIGAGYVHDLDAAKGQKTLTFQPELPSSGRYEVWLAYSAGGNRAARVPVTVFSADGEKSVAVDMRQAPPIAGRFVSLGQFRLEKDGQSFVLLSNEQTTGYVTADAVTFIPAERLPAILAYGRGAPPAAGEVTALEAAIKKLQAAAPQPPLAMAPSEETVIEDARVHIRGSVHSLGERVPRGFLRVALAGAPAVLPQDQSGRVQLADWIASPMNPLTARVYVNRAWHWLFGAGLVRTVDNFGTTGERPSHPELLDWLARRFIEDGWSTKKLVRRLVLSRAYQQASLAEATALAIDPENRLLSHANRRRLDAECLRDTILTVSGQLQLTGGGPGFPASIAADYGFVPAAPCRSVYLPVFRNALPALFEAFDFADPSMVTGCRTASTVAPQALFMLNNPFILDQARRAAVRLLATQSGDDAARIVAAYRQTLGRAPTAGEQQLAARFIASRQRMDAWAGLFQVLFASADFRYVE